MFLLLKLYGYFSLSIQRFKCTCITGNKILHTFLWIKVIRDISPYLHLDFIVTFRQVKELHLQHSSLVVLFPIRGTGPTLLDSTLFLVPGTLFSITVCNMKGGEPAITCLHKQAVTSHISSRVESVIV